jgi:hypothetical protein
MRTPSIVIIETAPDRGGNGAGKEQKLHQNYSRTGADFCPEGSRKIHQTGAEKQQKSSRNCTEISHTAAPELAPTSGM